MQLFATLSYLRKYDFSHGNPCFNTLKFKKEIVSYIYDGVKVASSLTLKLSDFSNAGLTVNKTVNNIKGKFLRLYSKSVIGEEELKKKNFDPFIENVKLETDGKSISDENVTIYKLKDPCKCVKSTVLFMYMKHLGLPVYTSSFDAYAFIVVLMAERGFYSAIMSDNQLTNFWKNMWVKNSDYEKIKERLRNFHENPRPISLNDILHVLSSLSLRCDMIDYGWSQIKKF